MYISSWQGLSPLYMLPGEGRPLNCPYPFRAKNKKYFYVARNAIYHLFRAMGLQPGETVLVPDYHAGNEVWATRAAGASTRYYHIGRDLRPDLNGLEKLCRTSNARVLYVTHFLGWPQPLPELQSLALKYNMILVEDCALALLSEYKGRALGSFGDFSIFCLYKTLPVPHGGMLAQNTMTLDGIKELSLESAGVRSKAGRTLELMVEWYRSRMPRSGSLLAAAKAGAGVLMRRAHMPHVPVGDIGFDISNVNLGMAEFCLNLIERFDFKAIREQRRKNYLYLQDRLANRVSLLFPELPEGVCPLFFPILAPQKRRLAEQLWAKNIGAVEFWNYGDREAQGPGFEDAQFLRDHVLELPIHQDLRPAQVEYIADQVLRCGAALAPARTPAVDLAVAG